MKKLTILITAVLFVFTANAQTNFNNNTVTGSNASALGENNTASGTNSFVSGYNSVASGNFSTAFGHSANATGIYSSALGSFSTSEGFGSITIGAQAKANPNGIFSIAIGNLVESHAGSNIILGVAPNADHPLINNISNSLMVGFQSDIPTFFVGSSSGQGTFGKVGIGTTTPIATLDVNGDLNFTGTLMQNGQEYSPSLWHYRSPDIWFSNNVGIGTSEIMAKLHVEGNLYVSETAKLSGIDLFNDAEITDVNQIIGYNDLRLSGDNVGGTDLYISTDGNVGIGTTTPISKLSVKGTIKAEEVIIELNEWEDIVFKKDYTLMSIVETEQFISENGHLPKIPSEEEMINRGLETKEIIKLQMQKIEELTLYIIELNKRIETLEKK